MAVWRVSPYHKKSCEEIERFRKDGMIVERRTGWRWGEWEVTTSDDNPPEFEFNQVPGGNDAKDSINMYDCTGNNIEEVEFIETFDGCWEDIVFPDEMDEEEQERLQELIDEEGFWEVFESIEDGWYQDDTDCWIWGPIAIKNENGDIVRIIVADDEGNVAYKTEKDYE